MRNRFALRLLCVTAMVCLTLPVFAQPGGGRGGRGGGGGRGGFGGGGGEPSKLLPLTTLLRDETVREEIDIMPDQTEALQKLGERSRPERPDFNAIREMSEDERTEFFTKMRKEAEERTEESHMALEQILLPPQLDRLNELAVQRAGVVALFTTHVIDELKITKEQQGKLKEAQTSSQEKMRESMRELFAGQGGNRPQRGEGGERPQRGEGGERPQRGEGGERPQRGGNDADREAMRTKFEEMRKTAENDVMAVLTSAQRSQFEELKGKKFEFPERTTGGRGGQGGRGGDQGGRGGRGGQGGRGGDQGGRGGDQGGRRPARPEAE